MIDPVSLKVTAEWIESHEKTVDLLKWIVVLMAAWAVGALKYLRQKFRRPIPTYEEFTSRCLIEEFDEFNGHKNAIRATFLMEIGIVNTTSEPIVVRDFLLSVNRKKFWRPWKPELIALSLPARPRHQTGSSMKILCNWFSSFPDEYQDLTLDGTIEPKHLKSGFLLFVCFATGSHSPRIKKEQIRIKANIRLTTGETLIVSGKVRTSHNKEIFEQLVPGIVSQVSHETAWGGIREG